MWHVVPVCWHVNRIEICFSRPCWEPSHFVVRHALETVAKLKEKLKLLFFRRLGTSLSRTRRITTWARVALACIEGGFACFNSLVYHYVPQKLESAPGALILQGDEGLLIRGGAYFVVVFLFSFFAIFYFNMKFLLRHEISFFVNINCNVIVIIIIIIIIMMMMMVS